MDATDLQDVAELMNALENLAKRDAETIGGYPAKFRQAADYIIEAFATENGEPFICVYHLKDMLQIYRAAWAEQKAGMWAELDDALKDRWPQDISEQVVSEKEGNYAASAE